MKTSKGFGRKQDTARDDWITPWPIYYLAESIFGKCTLDVCASDQYVSKCPQFYTPEQNGLLQPWFGQVWCNPPYKTKRLWIEKALKEKVPAVFLIPSYTEDSLFHEYIYDFKTGLWKVQVRFIPKRIKFLKPFAKYADTAPFASMFVKFN